MLLTTLAKITTRNDLGRQFGWSLGKGFDPLPSPHSVVSWATYMKRMVFHAKHYRIEVFGFCGDVWQCKVNLLRLSPERRWLWVPTIHTYSVPDERAEFRHEWVSLSLSPSGANAYSSRNHYTGHWECDLRTVLTYSEPLPRRFSYVVRLYQMRLVLVLQR